MSKVTVQDGLAVANGKPAVKIMVAMEEKIGLPKYSSVTVGPVSVSRYVEDGTDEELSEHIKATARILEDFISEERQHILSYVQETADV